MMFSNFKVTALMASPTATLELILFDAVLCAAKAKESLNDDYFAGANICATKKQIDIWLNPILDKKYGVYCASAGIGDNKEFLTSWSKRWDNNNDDTVAFEGKGKVRIDCNSGYFKNYHMPLILKSYKTITFYVRGDLTQIEKLLNTYIFYLGKKGAQGFGKIREWKFEEMQDDWSLWKDDKPMRPIPAKECIKWIQGKNINMNQYAIIPPYWRDDYKELCVIPEV